MVRRDPARDSPQIGRFRRVFQRVMASFDRFIETRWAYVALAAMVFMLALPGLHRHAGAGP